MVAKPEKPETCDKRVFQIYMVSYLPEMGVLVKMVGIRIKITALVFISAILLGAGFFFIYPVVSTLKKENPKKTSFMEYREREWEREGKKIKIRQVWTPYSRISPYLVKAVLIAEDDKFWSPRGF